ncbi:fungal-specific transcription factor domain-containing protein [Penicillium pulvis]|uniref:fungal-specific transcription factor domain-containing protein n=1 Tax=Penicillium pulvis TaxID=1562058 RepID=UPI00254848A9|nr:fungal-specific transcription factor domain-containing protein [Penicillium pulvis]KAJ5806376.1 fungal-specific transcription factor domain-containing protein [Penicillium pulvis]
MDNDQQESFQNKRKRLSLVPRACEAYLREIIKAHKFCREEHVNSLESRLRDLENQLSSRHLPAHSTGSTPTTDIPTNNARLVPVSNIPITLYEGDSSFISQSARARETAETIANYAAESNLNATFHSLKSLLQPASQNDRAVDHMTHNPKQIYLPLPAELVLAMLRSYQDEKPLFLSSYPFSSLSLVEDICQKVYFPMRPVSAGNVAAMHGILYFLMKESTMRKDALSKELNLEGHILNCKKSFEAAIESFDVLTVPTFENVIALVMGTLKAQDESKPLVCCQLVSAAARHCQMLGYHRESTYQRENDAIAENKRRIFWCIYVFDKSMSLLLGRASYIQDFDIDVRLPSSNLDPAIRPWDEAVCYIIKLARFQGQIYNKLYSASALKATASERVMLIQELELEMQECHRQRYMIDTSKVSQPGLFDIGQRTWDVLYYSALTSLLRASSSLSKGGEIGSKCFEAARSSLRSHLRCFPEYNNSEVFSVADYANWVLLYSSFTPFIVIFLHAIAATSMDDVNLLEEVVATLYNTRGVSSASERLYSIGVNFARVARGLVAAQKSCVGKYNEQEDSLLLSGDTRKPDASRLDGSTPQDPFGVDMMDYLTYPEAQDMSALFESWDCGQPSAMDLFGASLGDCSH